MTYDNVAAMAGSSTGAVYFVGPGAIFSRVALRTVETELDGPTHLVPDLDALRFARMTETGAVRPAYMVIVHESCAGALLDALAQGAEFLPKDRLAIAFENETTACAMFREARDELLQWRVSLLPMNTNVTNWVRLLQVIQAGGHYVPPELLQTQAPQPRPDTQPGVLPDGLAQQPDAGPDIGSGQAEPEARANASARANGSAHRTAATGTREKATGTRDTLTPREAEVLAMAAAGSPNKLIAGELDLSEHTVKLYMHRIIGKLGVRNRTEAAVWYHQRGQAGQHDRRA